MYLRDILIKNVGPITHFDLSLPLQSDGAPKPVVIVGQNGSGKTILLSIIADSLVEFAKQAFRDVVIGEDPMKKPYFRLLGATNQREGSKFGLSMLEFAIGTQTFGYFEKTGSLTIEELSSLDSHGGETT
jgi:ABC-type cobalamin/Fe3+-siderophores transport system ATPase subunit